MSRPRAGRSNALPTAYNPDSDDPAADDHRSAMVAGAVVLPQFGAAVTPMTASETARWATEAHGKRLLLNHNLHSLYLLQCDAVFRALYERASRTVIDGMPVLILARMRSRRQIPTSMRVGSTDWIELLETVDRPGRLFLFGADARSNAIAVDTLRRRLQPLGWAVDGVHGFVSWQVATESIVRARPTLVLIGLGMPLQERYISVHWKDLPDATYATVGGAIDYVAGVSKLAPRWIGRLGLEWMWRLANDPGRLWKRYLVEPFKLLWSTSINKRWTRTRGRHPRRPTTEEH